MWLHKKRHIKRMHKTLWGKHCCTLLKTTTTHTHFRFSQFSSSVQLQLLRRRGPLSQDFGGLPPVLTSIVSCRHASHLRTGTHLALIEVITPLVVLSHQCAGCAASMPIVLTLQPRCREQWARALLCVPSLVGITERPICHVTIMCAALLA